MYPDVGHHFLQTGDGASTMTYDSDFLYRLYCGLKPRLFKECNVEDSIIVEEDSFVDEFLLVQRGIIEVGFTRLTNFKLAQGNYIFAYRQQGYQTLLDHYVFASVPSDFVYRVKDENIEGYSISHDYVHRILFADNRYEDKFLHFKGNSLVIYRKTIYGRVNNRRKEHISMVKNL